MKKRVKMAFLLLACVVFGHVCVGQSNAVLQSEVKADGGAYTVWSAPSTVKIRQDDVEYADKGEAKIEINAVRNEYESYQLLISAEKAVENYDLTVADLTCGEASIDKENVEVYVEKYITVDSNVDNGVGYTLGNYPDALVPIDAYKTKEKTSIKENNNGALWITFYIPKDTVAGVYTSMFKLIVDEDTVDIPVVVKVNDYTLTDEITAGSTFTNRIGNLAGGELDNSNEMYTAYYEFFLDYRIASRYVPADCYTAEDYVQNILEYYEETPSYSIELGHVLSLAEHSTPERNLFDKAFYYYWDEPQVQTEATLLSAVEGMRQVKATLVAHADTIEADTTGKYDEFKKIANWRECVEDLDHIIPITRDTMNYLLENCTGSSEGETLVDEFLTLMNVWCPAWHAFSEDVERLQQLAENYGAELWWYSAWVPAAPYATYHIADANLLSARTVRWVQKKYDIGGDLYWDAYGYTSEDHGITISQSIDVYENPYRTNWLTAGDGNLCYPGAKYGVYGPLPSMRLMSMRDGLEEYEMLCDLENDYEGYKEFYGEDFDGGKVLDSFYNEVSYSNVLFYCDGENGLDFSAVRAELLDRLVYGDESGFVVYNTVVVNNVAKITYYVMEGYEVAIDGAVQTPVSGSAVKYEYLLDLSKDNYLRASITGENYSKEFVQFIADGTIILNAFDSAEDISRITVGENSAVEINQDETWMTSGGSGHVTVGSVITGDFLTDLAYKPTVRIGLNGEKDFGGYRSVQFEVYSVIDKVSVSVRLASGASSTVVKEIVLAKGKNTIEIPIADVRFDKLAQVDAIVLEFANGESEEVKYEIYIDNMYAVANKEE